MVDESPAAGSLGTDGDGEPLLLDLTPIADRLGADLGLPPGALGDEIALEVVSANELEACGERATCSTRSRSPPWSPP